jgi:hypothetical protein
METRKVTLKLLDRFAALDALPKQGSYVQMQIAKGLADVLNMKAAEIQDKEIKAEGNGLHWNTEKDVPQEFELSKIEFDAIVEGLKKLDKDGKIEPRHMNAYEVFVNGK